MFGPASVPEGCEYWPVRFWEDRPLIEPRSIFAHTMAAPGRSTVQSAWNWAHANPGTNTLPHYALGLVEADGCEKFLPTNRRGIANATVKEHQGGHGNIRDWSLAIETADTGTNADPTISAFTDYQLEMLTRIYVHECAGWGIPAVKLPEWHAAGCATHTDPFGYPYTTLYAGKFCPGSKKKAQFWGEVLPEVQRRLAPVTPPVPEPPIHLEAHMLAAIGKTTDGAYLAQFEFRGPIYTVGPTAAHGVTQAEVFGRGGGRAYDIVNQTVVSWSPTNPGSWGAVPQTHTAAQVRALMGSA